MASVNQDVPIVASVPFSRRLELPINVSIPISEVIETTITVDGPFGFDVPVNVTVPIELDLPVDLTVPIEIDEVIEVNTSTRLDLTVPVAVDLEETGLADLVRQTEELVPDPPALAAQTAVTAPLVGPHPLVDIGLELQPRALGAVADDDSTSHESPSRAARARDGFVRPFEPG